jgi:hypothetical protein
MTARIITLLLFALLSYLYKSPLATTEYGAIDQASQLTLTPIVNLRAVSGVQIEFLPQNGRTKDTSPPKTITIPHLVLYRNGELTGPSERTLIVEVAGLDVPPTGLTVIFGIETQHGDPDRDGEQDKRISIWRATKRITNSTGFTQTELTTVFTYEFKDKVTSGAKKIATPTDYLRFDFAVVDARNPEAGPLFELSADFAMLLENQWIARLPAAGEQSAGAAPDELVVFFCDMFPFQKSIHDESTWVPRIQVTEYVRTEIVSGMVEAYDMQTNAWGFPWYRAWTSYRPEEPQRLSVALTDGQTWFHGRAPGRGHSGISINVTGGENASYETLADGLLSTFHHELFHNLQRNIALNSRCSLGVDGVGSDWDFIIEGSAVAASSVGQPGVQFDKDSEQRANISKANLFIGGDGSPGGLNRSYEQISPYHAAIYWRFLYEQCAGLRDQPDVGMQILRQALTAFYAYNPHEMGEFIESLPRIMDSALESSLCPFTKFEDSIIAFAGSIYALRLEGGRCLELGIPSGCGFYDPNLVYRDPQVKTIPYYGKKIDYSEVEQLFPPGIKSSFGMDFVDVLLDPITDGQPLSIEFISNQNAEAQFNVQIWSLIDSGFKNGKPHVSKSVPFERIRLNVGEDGRLIYFIPALDSTRYNRLGIIITRIDAEESSDPIGAYSIILHPCSGSILFQLFDHNHSCY